jgi:hypothetical protein
MAKITKAKARRMLEEIKSKSFRIMGDCNHCSKADRTQLMQMFDMADRIKNRLK